MFAIMKTIQGIENGRAESEFKLSARRVVELAPSRARARWGSTTRSARSRPASAPTSSSIDTRAANLACIGDPAVMLVTAVQPANVDTVLVDGRILKRNGKLTAMKIALIAKESAEANVAVRKRANWW